MHCLITVVTMVLYKQKKREKEKHIWEFNLLAVTCKDFFQCKTIRNLLRIKMLPFSCTKEKFMKTSAVRNVILCLYLLNGPDDLWEICWFTLDQVCKDILKNERLYLVNQKTVWWFESLSMVSLPLYYKALVCSLCSSSIRSCNVLQT